MSCVMSLVITLSNVGFIDGLLTVWLESWGFAFIVAFPTVNIVAPVVRKMVAAVVEGNPGK